MKEAKEEKGRKRTSEELDNLVISKIEERPDGIGFNEIKESLKISPSVLARHLHELVDSLRVEKSGELYRIEGLGSFRTILSICMSKIVDYIDTKKNPDELIIALNELVGAQGNPVPQNLKAKYISLIQQNEILELIELTEEIWDSKKLKDIEWYEFPLTLFTTASLKEWKRQHPEEDINKEIWRLIISLEEKVFLEIQNEIKDSNVEKQDITNGDNRHLTELWGLYISVMVECRYSGLWDVIEHLFDEPNDLGSERYYTSLLRLFTSSSLMLYYGIEVMKLNQGKLFSLAMNTQKGKESRRGFFENLRRRVLENAGHL